MKVLLINSDDGPDYLADCVNYFFITNNYDIYTNHIIDFLFEDYVNPRTLYGKGFTLYGKLNKNFKNKINEISITEILDTASSFDVIVITSINRKYKSEAIKKDLFQKLNERISNSNLIVLDGDDSTNVDVDVASSSLYFKRELTERYKSLAMPISFTFPYLELNKNLIDVNNKTQILAPMDPRFQNSYIYNDETTYFNQYIQSIFGVTTKKAGWDCLRHYEILSCNTLLFFPDINDKPPLTMAEFPVNLQKKVNDLFIKLILSESNFDTLEKIRLKYPSKNYFTRGIKKIKRKLSKLNLIENNFIELNKYSKEFNEWFANHGTTQSYKKVLRI